ncbi:hypothetical protein ES705_29027 [subsurface metagenome]|nr:MAG: hypothetical protein ES695_00170 [Candidatus Atribacteria bacterium 1244-E10-H5-B2]
MKWEYKVIENQTATERTNKELMEKTAGILSNRTHLTVDKLNQLGDDGWELISYRPQSDSRRAIAIFKRLKNQG